MRTKGRWAAFAVTVGLLAGSLGGGIAVGASGGDAMKQGDAMEQSSGDAMKKDASTSGDAMQQDASGSGAAMQQQDPAASGAAMSAAQMTG
ncbi:MAG TPA: hypothetical protein VKB25_08485 [Conexibacter sp.]|nr:hypothetical protein [Conexibacter sp.]